MDDQGSQLSSETFLKELATLCCRLRRNRAVRELLPEEREPIIKSAIDLLRKELGPGLFRPVIRGEGTIQALSLTGRAIIAHTSRGEVYVGELIEFWRFLLLPVGAESRTKDKDGKVVVRQRLSEESCRIVISLSYRTSRDHLAPANDYLDFLIEEAIAVLRKGLPEINFLTIKEAKDSRSFTVDLDYGLGQMVQFQIPEGQTLRLAATDIFGEDLWERACVYNALGGHRMPRR